MIVNFFNSGFFIALTTLLVGSFAIGIYIKQKGDYKRDVALLIRQEIIHAEQHVANAQSFSQEPGSYPLSVKLLPTNSWYKNIHLFINDFEQPQIDAISRFYAQVEYIDAIIEKISDYKTSIIEQKILTPQGKEIASEPIFPDKVSLSIIAKSLASRMNDSGDGAQLHQGIQATLNAPSQQPSMNVSVTVIYQLVATNILKEVSAKVEFLYNTPIGEKFKDISQQKRLWIF